MATQPYVMPGTNNGHSAKDKSIPELMRDLVDETTTLLQQEVDLAKAEMTQKAKEGSSVAALFGGAALVGMLALGALTACVIAALALAIPLWSAALVVAAGYLVIAAMLAMMGKDRLKELMPAQPEQTIESVKEDVQWAKIQAQSGRA